MRYIEDFKEDDQIIGHYLCKQRQSLKSRAGKTYLSLKLQDKTGLIDAKIWEINNNIQNFEENDYVKIDGTVLSYQNELQLRINKLRRSQVGEYFEFDYIPTTDKNIDELYKKVTEYVYSVNNPFVKKLLEEIFINNKEIAESFKGHSAAKTMHHSYMGGLIEHTVSVAQICDFMSSRYKSVNRDILIATALLHDVGKIYELSDFPDNDYTDDGQLLGHIIIGMELVSATASKIEKFPNILLKLIKHSIIAHHGEYEFGSPKKPKTIEAYILHCADNMDAKVKMFEEIIEKDNTLGNWVGYQKMLERNIRKSNLP
ncbi:MAG: HD domain-containing protein [Clostridiales bacterium]|jgi:3'-5' exoribonuclease|nr:HD domain-containing protein [Clostridiales bacterium]